MSIFLPKNKGSMALIICQGQVNSSLRSEALTDYSAIAYDRFKEEKKNKY